MRPSTRTPTALWVRLEEWIEQQTGPWGGPNQTDIAKALKLSTSAISEWKYGDSVPSMDNLQALSEFTKIPFPELVTLIEETIQARRVRKASRRKSQP